MTTLLFSTPNELQRQLGERLKRLRLSHNLDQQTTAEKAGISEKALRNLETGRGSTVETLLRVLKALDSLQGIDLLAPEGNSYGYHENYLVSRTVPFDRITRVLTPFLVTRPIFAGAGKVGAENQTTPTEYQISQRADLF